MYTEICSFHFKSLGWWQILVKINEGDVCLLLLSFFFSEPGKTSVYSGPTLLSLWVKQQTSKSNQKQQLQQQRNFAFSAASTCAWELCSGGGDLLTVQPGRSTGPRKLWDVGTFMCAIHILFACPFYSQRACCSVNFDATPPASACRRPAR